MSHVDFNDPAVDRKFAFQMAQKGCGLHYERFVCLFDMGNAESLTDDLHAFMIEMSKMHYEADFVAATSAENNLTEQDRLNDNCYYIDSVLPEQFEYLRFRSRIAISEEMVRTQGVETIKPLVIAALKKDNFKRDETTKQAVFRISHSAGGR